MKKLFVKHKANFKFFILFSICFFFVISGCSKVGFYELYPEDFKIQKSYNNTLAKNSALRSYAKDIGLNNVAIEKKQLSESIISALPIDFQLAELTGYLITVFDAEGKMFLTKENFDETNVSPLGIQRSKSMLSVRKRLIEEGYIPYEPRGYPHVICFKPNDIDFEQALNNSYFADWIIFLNQWEELKLRNNNQENLLFQLLEKFGEGTEYKKTLENKIENTKNKSLLLDKEITTLSQNIDTSLAELNRVKDNFRILIEEPYYFPPFLNKIPYKYKDDFFKEAYEENLVNIKDKPWCSNQVSNQYLQRELVEAIDIAWGIVSNPDENLSSDPQDQELANQLKLSQIDSFKISSASRSPWMQAVGLSKSPIRARYLNSNHLIGIAFDLALKNTKYDVKKKKESDITEANKNNYNLILKVFVKAGIIPRFNYSVKPERNHFELKKYSLANKNRTLSDRQKLSRFRLKMFKSLEKVAFQEIFNLTNYWTKLNENITTQNLRMATLQADIDKKEEALKKQELILAKKIQQKKEKQKQLAEIRNKVQRAKEERERRERERREREMRHREGEPRNWSRGSSAESKPREGKVSGGWCVGMRYERETHRTIGEREYVERERIDILVCGER